MHGHKQEQRDGFGGGSKGEGHTPGDRGTQDGDGGAFRVQRNDLELAFVCLLFLHLFQLFNVLTHNLVGAQHPLGQNSVTLMMEKDQQFLYFVTGNCKFLMFIFKIIISAKQTFLLK